MNLEAVALYFLSPLTLALFLVVVAGVCRAIRWRRASGALVVVAFAVLWISSTPIVADAMLQKLEGQYRAMAPEATPAADAIIVLGGAIAGIRLPDRPFLVLGVVSFCVWLVVVLYRAGKGKVVVVAAGNRVAIPGQQVEADAIAQMLIQLGVPASAIRLERESRTTRENARNVRAILQELGVKRALLVTSAAHMPRAMHTFATVWGFSGPELIPAVTDARSSALADPRNLWLPSLDGLLVVTKCLKEFAGKAVLEIIQ